MKPVLRPAAPEDSEFVFRVKEEALGEYVRQTWGWDETFQRAFHAKSFDPATIRIISCLDAEVGWLEVDRGDDEIRLTGIYILPEYQSRGVGSVVIKDLISEATEKKLVVTLEVLRVNPRARALYENLGFVVNGETDTHFLMQLAS